MRDPAGQPPVPGWGSLALPRRGGEAGRQLGQIAPSGYQGGLLGAWGAGGQQRSCVAPGRERREVSARRSTGPPPEEMGCAHRLPSALLLLLLLLRRGEASASPPGEPCQGWAPAPFHCPQARDGADASAHAAPRETTPLGEPRAPQPSTRDPRWKSPGFVAFIVTAVGTMLCFLAYYCKERCCHWSYRNLPSREEASESVRLRTFRRSRTRAVPRYGALEAEDQRERAPAHAQAEPSGTLEKEQVVHPLVRGNIPGHVLQPALDAADQGSPEKEEAASGTNYPPTA